MNSATVVAIGGGVIGLSTAYQLALKRVGRVALLDKGPVGDGASCRAAGIVTHLMWSETGTRARRIGFRLADEPFCTSALSDASTCGATSSLPSATLK